MSIKPILLVTLLAAVLRLFLLSSNPPSLYWDELSLGYNAFSILTHGTDEHGVSFPLTHFLAFGDAKPPLYIYATSLSMAFFGINDFAVRFPSALAGILAIPLTYLLANLLFAKHPQQRAISLTSAFLLTISPWHLQMSRAAFEANLALTLFFAGFVAFLAGLRRPKWWFISAICFSFTLYTFNAYRIFLPLFLVILAIFHFRHLIRHKSHALMSVLTAVVILLPLIQFIVSPQAQLRFQEVSIFNDLDPVVEANLRQELNNHSLLSKVLFNRRLLYAGEFLRHSADHLRPDFLFFYGDDNPRLSVRDIGQMYLIELPLVLLGLFLAFRRDTKLGWFLVIWALLSFIPAGIARETPHALRILQILPVPYFLVALGLVNLSSIKTIKFLLAGLFAFALISYLDIYYLHAPSHWSPSWQYAYKPLFSTLKPIYSNYDRVYISDKLGRAYIATLYYLRIPVDEYLSDRDSGQDEFGFTFTHRFGQFYFIDPPSELPQGQTWLIVTTPSQLPSDVTPLSTITNLSGQETFVLYEKSG